MANVAHASLTGAELHEPKGADLAALGTVYVADGAGSGSWASVGTSSFTGMIADFPAIEAPAGWLELDGSIISTATYSGLFAVMSKTSSGTRTNGSAIVTSIPDTSKFKIGYYIFGTGIAAGTTILTIDSASQVTMSANAGSSGSSSFFVSPWVMGTGTVTLPDVTTVGRFRRSRTASTKVGDLQADQNKAHVHSGTTSNQSADHTHSVSITSGGMTANTSHTHGLTAVGNGSWIRSGGGGSQSGGGAFGHPDGSVSVNSANTEHTHLVSGSTLGVSTNHNHTYTTSSEGGTEARPLGIVFMTCVKT